MRLTTQEIQNANHTNALLVKILLSQAQAQGLELAVDTNSLENEFLLKQAGWAGGRGPRLGAFCSSHRRATEGSGR